MSKFEHDGHAELTDFLAGYGMINTGEVEYLMQSFAVIGLTNFGERPVSLTRWEEVMGRPLSEAQALAQQLSWPPTRLENGLMTVNPERDPLPPRRHVQFGDRRFGVTGCAPDGFLYAPLVRPSLLLEEVCSVTGTHIRIVFTPALSRASPRAPPSWCCPTRR